MDASGLARVPASEFALVASLFVVLSLAWTLPLAATFGQALPSDLGDPLLNTWILAWGADRAAHGFHGLWNAPIFFPYPGTLAYSEHLLGLLPFTAPVQWLTRNPVSAYNVAFLFSYVLAGTGMFVLARSVCGRRDAAFLAALAFAFSPYRTLQEPHLQVLMSGWMPLALWALHRYLGHLSARMLALLVVVFLFQALSNGYLLYYLPVALLVVAARDVPWRTRARWRALGGLAVAAAFVLAALAPVASVYYQVRREQGLVRSPAEMAHFSADAGSYLRAPNRLRLWGPVLGQPVDTEGTLFPGAAVLVLAATALVTWRAGRSRHAVTYALVAAAAFMLSLGPRPTFGRYLQMQNGPYAWLAAIVPGLDGLRVPARLGLVVMLALAVLAAIGASVVLRRLSGWSRRAAVAALGAVIIAEGYGGPMRMVPFNPHGRPSYRPAYEWLARQPPGALLTLPVGAAGTTEATLGQQYATLIHRHPLINGFSGYQSPIAGFIEGPYAQPFLTLENLPATLDFLRAIGARYILLSEADYLDGALARATFDAFSALSDQFVLRSRLGAVWVFTLKSAAPPPAPDARALAMVPPAAFRATASHEPARLPLAFDGDVESRWLSGQPQSGNEWISLTFERPRDIAIVRLVVGRRSFFDYPRELVVESSEGGTVFRETYRGTILKELWLGLLRSPAFPAADITLPRNRTVILRLRQTGHARTPYWSIHELTIFER
ncbi:MAG: hypothetical protein IMZ44_03980 [Planctomycetes bacterium]|nr:hypothetical protein [Planctomycetota bacterium]